MAAESNEPRIQELTAENERLRAALQKIRDDITPFLGAQREGKRSTITRTPEDQLIHDLRNILNELVMLRALNPDDSNE